MIQHTLWKYCKYCIENETPSILAFRAMNFMVRKYMRLKSRKVSKSSPVLVYLNVRKISMLIEWMLSKHYLIVYYNCVYSVRNFHLCWHACCILDLIPVDAHFHPEHLKSYAYNMRNNEIWTNAVEQSYDLIEKYYSLILSIECNILWVHN